MEFAAAEFKLQAPRADGKTEKEHYAVVADSPFMVGAKDEAADEVVAAAASLECPEDLVYIWDIFSSMQLGRQNSGYGPMRLSETDLYSWQLNHRFSLSVFEVDVIRSLESAYMTWYSEFEEQRTKK